MLGIQDGSRKLNIYIRAQKQLSSFKKEFEYKTFLV